MAGAKSAASGRSSVAEVIRQRSPRAPIYLIIWTANCHGVAAKPNACLGDNPASAAIRQPLDPLGRKACKRGSHAVSRNRALGRNFRERNQDEGALEQPRMRQRQRPLVELDIVIGDEIEVEGARAPAPFMRAVAAELLLDLVQREQQRMGIEAGLDYNAGIDEVRLLFVTPGRRGVIRRPRPEHAL